MAMVCPQCSGSFEQRLSCPQCGVRLTYQSPTRSRGVWSSPIAWQQTSWGRILIGFLLAQGLYYVLKQLVAASLLAAVDEANLIWSTLTSLVVIQGLRAVSVFVGGLVSGAGYVYGFGCGAIVGLANGLFFTLLQDGRDESTTLSLFGEPLLHAAFAAIGGMIGTSIWKPLTPVAGPAVPLKPVRRARTDAWTATISGPIAWGRVLLGSGLAVAGVLGTDIIRGFVLDASEGKLRVDTHLQAQMVSWEIAGLALLAGGAIGGATTRNGLKQGLAVGLASGIILTIARLVSNDLPLKLLLFTFLAALVLGLIGGWFGSQLLPPISLGWRRRRHRIATL